MFSHPMIDTLYNHTITKVSGVRVLPFDSGSTVPFHKNGSGYKLYCYIPAGDTRLQVFVHQPMIKLPTNFPQDAVAKLNIGGHIITDRCFSGSILKKDGSAIDTKVPEKNCVEFLSVNLASTKLFDDFCVLLNYFMSKGDEQWGAGFMDGSPLIAELDLTVFGDDINVTESDDEVDDEA